jgi:hypothetical protein
MLEVIAAEISRPVPVGVKLIDHDGALFSAMAVQVGLSIALEVQPAHHHSAGDWAFPYRRANDPALPFDFAWQPDVDGHQLQFMPL